MRLIKYGTRLNKDRLPYLVREMSQNYAGKNMGNSLLAYNILKDIEEAGSLAQEKFWMFCLDNKMHIIGYFTMFAGAKSLCPVDKGLLFTNALAAGAANIILAHNHPSGDLAPSDKDIALTKDVCQGADLLGMCLQDHLIVTDGAYTSIRETCPEIFSK